MSLAQVMLYVKDLDAMRAFYRDALALVVTEERDGWVAFDAGGVTLALHAIPPQYAEHIEITRPPTRRSETPYKLTFRAPDLVRARESVERLGGVVSSIDEARFEALDPEGNVFVVRG